MVVDPAPAAMRGYVRALQLEQAIPEKVWPLVELRRYMPGEYLCRSGDRLNFFWLIVDGKCKVLSSNEEGKMVMLSYLEPPGLNGDIELFNDCPSLHSVCAAGRVAAIAIPRRVFFTEMMQNLAFLQMLCKSFAAKIYQSSSQHSSTMLYPVKVRLSQYILAKAEDAGRDVFTCNIGETAQSLGITARHLRRVLASLEAEGLIERENRQVRIVDRQGLYEKGSRLP